MNVVMHMRAHYLSYRSARYANLELMRVAPLRIVMHENETKIFNFDKLNAQLTLFLTVQVNIRSRCALLISENGT